MPPTDPIPPTPVPLVFLDIDGVLTTARSRAAVPRVASIATAPPSCEEATQELFEVLDPACVLLLNNLVGEVSFVVSSHRYPIWRVGSIELALERRGFRGTIDGVSATDGGNDKSAQIRAYLARCAVRPRYVAIDDTPLNSLVYVKVDDQQGLTRSNVSDVRWALGLPGAGAL